MFAAEKSFVTDVESDHGERPASLKDDLRGFGVGVNVGFGRGVDVAALDGAAHENDFLDERNDGWIFFDSKSDIGKRANGYEGDFMRDGMDELDDEIGAVARVHFAFAGGEFDIGEAVLAVPELGGDELLKKRLQ